MADRHGKAVGKFEHFSIGRPQSFHDALFFQILKADIGNHDCKYNQNRRADNQRKQCEAEGCRPIIGHHHAYTDSNGYRTQSIGCPSTHATHGSDLAGHIRIARRPRP